MANLSATRVVAPSLVGSSVSTRSGDRAATGNAAAWGENDVGQLGTLPAAFGGDGKSSDAVYESVPTAPGASQLFGNGWGFLALYPDGSVTAWGGQTDEVGLGATPGGKPVVPTRVPVATVTGLSSSYTHTLFVTSAGFVYGVGDTFDAELGPNAFDPGALSIEETVTQIPIGSDGLAVLKAVAAGPGTSYALDSDGHVWAWGENLHGEWGNGVESGLDTTPGEYGYDPDPTPTEIPGLTDVKAISAFNGGAYALKTDGTVWEWGSVTGSLSPVQVPGLSGVASIAPSNGGWTNGYPTVVKTDGTVWTVPFGAAAAQVPGITTAVAVAVASNETSGDEGEALLRNGQVWSWNSGDQGTNSWGQLGNGNTAPSSTPVRALGVTGAVSVAISSASNHFAEGTIAAVPTPPGGPLTLKEMPGGSNPSEICVKCAEAERGDPVNTATGRLTESYDDLSIPGRGPALDLNRTYNSATASQDSLFGFGWSTDYGMNLSVGADGVVTVSQENASQVAFTPDGSGYSAPSRVQATLTHNGDGTWTMLRRAQSSFTFDMQGRLIAITDLNNLTTTVTYPTSSAMVISDPAGRSFTLALSGGHITSLTDSSSPARVVRYGYDSSGNLASVIDAALGKTTFGYDSAHQLTQVTTPNNQASGASTVNIYDSSGRVTQQTDPLGRVTHWTYSTQADGGLATDTIDPAGHVTVDRYDAYGLRSSQTIASGTSSSATTTYHYDMNTLGVTAECDALGHCTTRTYDASGNVRSSTDPLGRTTHYSYNDLNEVTVITTPMGFRTTKTYDAAGNLLRVAQPVLDSSGASTGTKITRYGYGGGSPSYPGDVTSMTDPNGNTWQYRYDAYGDRISERAPATAENADGDKTTFGYDTGRGVRTWVTSPKGNLPGASPADYRTRYAYDALNRTTVTTDPLWDASNPTLHRVVRTYDGDGNVTRTRGSDGNTTVRTFDAADQLINVSAPGPGSSSESYTSDGMVATRTDPNGHVTGYEYDPADHLLKVTDPLGHLRCMSYDAAGQLAVRWTATGTCGTPGTTAAHFFYDAAGQETNSWFGDGSWGAGYQYDADGRRTTMDDNSGDWTYAYDSLGEQLSAQNGVGDTVTHTYDLDGNETSIGYPGSKTVRQYFDAEGRMSSLTDWLGDSSTFGYDANSNLDTTVLPTATGETDMYAYDPTDELTSVNAMRGATTLASFSYTRDGAGRVATSSTTGVTDPAQSVGYTAAGSLDHSGPADTPTSYSYDRAQQLTAIGANSTLAYDAGGELCWSAPAVVTTRCGARAPTGATVFGYDDAGNRTSQAPAGGPSTTYSYDSASDLTGATSTSGLSANYVYDGDGLRFSKTVRGTTNDWAWDTTSDVPQILSDGVDQFIYGPDGLPLEQVSGDESTVTYLHHDQVGSTRLLTSGSGAIVGATTYSPYGAATSTSGTVKSPLGFAGQYADAETGLIYMRAREYDPSTGSFLTVDPDVDDSGQPYAYANSNPESFVDPTGEFGWSDVEGGAAALGEGAVCVFGGCEAAAGAALGAAAILGIGYGVYKLACGIVLSSKHPSIPRNAVPPKAAYGPLGKKFGLSRGALHDAFEKVKSEGGVPASGDTYVDPDTGELYDGLNGEDLGNIVDEAH